MQSGATHVELKALRPHGWTISQLAREYGLSCDTLRQDLTSEHLPHDPERLKPIALTDAQEIHVEHRLVICSNIRGAISTPNCPEIMAMWQLSRFMVSRANQQGVKIAKWSHSPG